MNEADARENIRRQLLDSADVKRRVSELLLDDILQAAMILAEALASGKKMLICGNGGSAADSQHIAAELVGRLRAGHERPSLPAIALTTDSSIVTAIGNDYGFDQVYARQVEGLGESGDVLIGISTSGNSSNIVKAVQVARERQLRTIGLLGQQGILRDLVECPIAVPSTNTQRIQEAHIAIGHIICELVEDKLFYSCRSAFCIEKIFCRQGSLVI